MTAKKKQKKPINYNIGRPKKDFDPEAMKNMCYIQCTQAEIAFCLNVSIDFLNRYCKKHYNECFSEYYEKQKAGGKMSMRRSLFKLANEGNIHALKFALKNYCGMSENPDGNGGEILQNFSVTYNLSGDSDKATITDGKGNEDVVDI